MPERISIEGTILKIELGELEARVISRSLPLFAPLVSMYIFMMCRLILGIASLGKEKAKELRQRLEQGEDAASICKAAGIDTKALLDKDIQWPSDEEIDEALGCQNSSRFYLVFLSRRRGQSELARN